MSKKKIKLEPLKNKMIEEIYKADEEGDACLCKLFFKKDVASAVKWLKEQLIVKYMASGELDPKFVSKKIDKAFEDVCVNNGKEKNN